MTLASCINTPSEECFHYSSVSLDCFYADVLGLSGYRAYHRIIKAKASSYCAGFHFSLISLDLF